MSTDDATDATAHTEPTSPEPTSPAPSPSETPAAQARAALAIATARAAFTTGMTRSIPARLHMLEALDSALRAERRRLLDAVHADLRKNPTEAVLTEIGVLHREIAHARKNLARWAKPRRFAPGLTLAPASGRIQPEPYGVALVISPWNYPISLAIAPVIAAIAAGNTVVLKPSELAPATSAAVARLIRERLDGDWVQVIEGGVEETTALLAERSDIILYTGNGTVGRIVARAAAEHLTPTILELGGKSPVFVDADVDLAVAARRIVWGKFTNAGQTCVAPDYVMATPATIGRLIPHLRRAVTSLYGADPYRSRDYGRIVNAKHTQRLLALMDADRCVIGGPDQARPEENYLPPTIMVDVTAEDAVMGEEIFGPILPLVAVADHEDAIARINAGDKPLTAYVFSGSRAVQDAFAERTSSGSLALDLTIAHVGSTTMPFGGVGESGMGQYHGRAGFDAFSHPKPILRKPLAPDTLRAIMPPYGAATGGLLRRFFG